MPTIDGKEIGKSTSVSASNALIEPLNEEFETGANKLGSKAPPLPLDESSTVFEENKQSMLAIIGHSIFGNIGTDTYRKDKAALENFASKLTKYGKIWSKYPKDPESIRQLFQNLYRNEINEENVDQVNRVSRILHRHSHTLQKKSVFPLIQFEEKSKPQLDPSTYKHMRRNLPNRDPVIHNLIMPGSRLKPSRISSSRSVNSMCS